MHESYNHISYIFRQVMHEGQVTTKLYSMGQMMCKGNAVVFQLVDLHI
jgi:hypothetical protein